MPLVAITRLRVRSWRYLPIFFLQALRSDQASAAQAAVQQRPGPDDLQQHVRGLLARVDRDGD